MSDNIEEVFGDYEDQIGEDIGLTDDDKGKVKSPGRNEWFKGEKGRSYRCAFLYFHPMHHRMASIAKRKDPKADVQAVIKEALAKRAEKLGKQVDQLTPVDLLDTSTCQFKKIVGYYAENVEGVGYVTPAQGVTADEKRWWEKAIGEGRDYICTILLIYPTDREGKIDKNAFQRGESILIPWRFSGKMYEKIFDQNAALSANNLRLAQQDFILKCTNDQYQQFDISAAGPALYQKNEEFKRKMLEAAVELYPKMIPFKVMTTDQLKEKMGVTPTAQADDVSESDIEDMFSNV